MRDAAVMWTYHADLLAAAVPRYTSFPTAAEFSPAVGRTELAAALAATTGEVSLYVHIPFCEAICWYCGCNTAAANRRERLASYLGALHDEVALVGAQIGRGARIGRIAFGGGSPNAIQPAEFLRIVEALHRHFALAERPVWSIELDPRTLTPAWAEAVRAVGIGNASMGVQTFSPRLQQAIGRVQPERDIREGTALLRAAGVASLNFDLMYGLPGQTRAELDDALARSSALGADRIALFGYAHVPHLIPRQRRIDARALPDQAARFALAARGHDTLVGAGYQPIGFDHFARAADALAIAARERRLALNFQGFTDDAAPVLIGLGASAISCFPELLVQNEKNAGRYRMLVSDARLPAAQGVVRSAEDRTLGAIIAALLCDGEAEIGDAAAVVSALAPFIARGLARLDGGRLGIAPDGLPYARSIAALFDPYRRQSPRRFSAAL